MIRRSPHAQLEAMRKKWPGFKRITRSSGLEWVGQLQPKSQAYAIQVIWDESFCDRPYVILRDPVLRPRNEGEWARIPHLLYHDPKPTLSGLCLFDPDRDEWTPAHLLADTTIPWTSEWLTYYELWHLTGEWLAPGVGAESVATARIQIMGGVEHESAV